MSEQEAKDVHEWCAAVIGEGIEEAEDVARDAGFSVRRTVVDGKPRVVTRDFRTDRINFEVQGGKVTRATVG